MGTKNLINPLNYLDIFKVKI